MTEQNQASPMVPMRVGLGYDVHAFAPDRKLILGGVEIPHHQGLLGHSDADVLAHAVADALLAPSAAGTSASCSPTPTLPTKGQIRSNCLPLSQTSCVSRDFPSSISIV